MARTISIGQIPYVFGHQCVTVVLWEGRPPQPIVLAGGPADEAAGAEAVEANLAAALASWRWWGISRPSRGMQRLTAWLRVRQRSGVPVWDGATPWIEVQAAAGDVYLVQPDVDQGVIAAARAAAVQAHGSLTTRHELLVLAGFVGRYR